MIDTDIDSRTAQQHDPPSIDVLPDVSEWQPHPHDELLARLEASYEFHTEQLVRLAADRGTDPRRALVRDSLAASSRQALTAIAAALRDMADGRYGRCEGCDEPIPAEHLYVRPEARYCARCQARQPG